MEHMKLKRDRDEEEDVEKSASESDASQPEQRAVKPKKASTSKATKPSKAKTAKKPKYDVSAEKGAVKVLKNSDGDSYVDLGKKKHATVRSFKGQLFLDIREFYGADGDEKPGKKGITLSSEQWEALKLSVDTIDSFFVEHRKM